MALGKRIQNYPDGAEADGTEFVPVAQLNPDISISGTTISANASAQTITDTNGGFLAAGFYVGLAVRVVSALNNHSSLIITAVTADVLTFAGSDGSAIVTEGTGGTFTITAWHTVRLPLPSSSLFPYKEVTTGTYTFLLEDRNRRIAMNYATGNVVNVPNSSSADFPLNTEIEVIQIGAGETTLVAGVGVTLNSRAGLVFPSQYAVARLKKRAGNIWDVSFDETLVSLGITTYGAQNKTTPVDADIFPLGNSSSFFIWAKVTWANIKDTLRGTGLLANTFGYRGLPQNSQSGNYTITATDSGWHILHPSGGGASDIFTIPSNASVAFEVGITLTFVNRDSNSLSIAIASDTMYLANSTTTGTRTLAQNSWATAMKVESTVWLISGPGLS